MHFFTIIVVILAYLKFISTQYYQNSDYDSAYTPQSAAKSEDIEQKYVNSGQSVLLVCDLPNSMPDGKVSIFSNLLILIERTRDLYIDALFTLIINVCSFLY